MSEIEGIENTHFMYGLLDTLEKFETITAKEADVFQKDVNAGLKEMQKLQEEKMEELHKAKTSSLSSKTWSYISSAAGYLSMVPGFVGSKLSEGSPGSWLLLASSTTGLATTILKSTGCFKAIANYFATSEEMKAKIASRLEMGMYAASASFLLVGTMKAYKANSSQINEGVKSLGRKALVSAGKATEVFAGVRKSYLERQTEFSRACIDRKQAIIYQVTHAMEQGNKALDRMLQTIRSLTESVKESVQTIKITGS